MSKPTDSEHIHCIINKCYAFKIPNTTTSTGQQAKDWPKVPIWTGRARVVTRGSVLTILLEHTDKDGLFAQCPVTSDRVVEPVIDSSRYFVLRLEDGKGRHAFIGIGFNSREEAFEFKVALQDAENQKTSKQRAEKYLTSLPTVDLSLPEGQRITVNLPSKKPAESKKKSEKKSDATGPTGFALAPPPSSGTKPRRGSGQTASTNSSSNPSSGTKTMDLFGLAPSQAKNDDEEEEDEDASPQQPTPKQTSSSAPANDVFDPFADMVATSSKTTSNPSSADDWVAF